MLFTSKMCIRSFPQIQSKKDLFQLASSSFFQRNVMPPYRRSCLLKVYIKLSINRDAQPKKELVYLYYYLSEMGTEGLRFLEITKTKKILKQPHFRPYPRCQCLVIDHVSSHKILYCKTCRVEYGYLFVVFPSGFDACNDLTELCMNIGLRENTRGDGHIDLP